MTLAIDRQQYEGRILFGTEPQGYYFRHSIQPVSLLSCAVWNKQWRLFKDIMVGLFKYSSNI